MPCLPVGEAWFEDALRRCRGLLGDEGLCTAMDEGRGMTPEAILSREPG